MKSVPLGLVSILLALGSFTWWALESSGIAIIETHAPDGSVRSTHVWFAEPGGEIWLEAGTPKNPWYTDIQRDPVLSFSSGRRSQQFIARPIEDRDAHGKVRSLLREKYGLRDRWIALIFDTSRSIAVRLVPRSRDDSE
jgi:hypothetical protein